MNAMMFRFTGMALLVSFLLLGIPKSADITQVQKASGNTCTSLPLPSNLTYVGGLNDGTHFFNGLGNAVRAQHVTLGATDVLLVAVGQKVNGSGTLEVYFVDPNSGALLDGTNIGSSTGVQPHISLYIGVPIRSISGGDVNADGIPDFALGSPQGVAFAMVGLVSNGILSYQLLSLGAPSNSAAFGASTAMGDLDGDAGDEIAVGATGSSKFIGKVSIYKFNSVAFDNTQTISSPLPNSKLDDLFGSGLAIGNVAGTSANDLVVGASGSTVSGAALAGRIFVFPGPISASNFQTLTTGTRNDQFGSSVLTGNVDGGFTDLIGATSGTANSPRASVYTGATSSGQSPGFTLQPIAGRNTSIWSVRDSSDLNGDGLDEVMASAPAGCGGTAYLYLSNINGPLPLSTRVAFQSPVQGQSEFGWSAAIGPGSRLIFVSDTLISVGSSFPNNGQVYVFKLN